MTQPQTFWGGRNLQETTVITLVLFTRIQEHQEFHTCVTKQNNIQFTLKNNTVIQTTIRQEQ